MFGCRPAELCCRPATDAPRPAIVVVSGTYADQLAEEFGRYAATMRSRRRPLGRRGDLDHHVADATGCAGRDVRLDCACPTASRRPPSTCCGRWCPPAAGSSSRPGTTSARTRSPSGQRFAKGKFDAFSLMPRGPRATRSSTSRSSSCSMSGARASRPASSTPSRSSRPTAGAGARHTGLSVPDRRPELVYPPDSAVGRTIVAAYDGEPTVPLARLQPGRGLHADLGPRRRHVDPWAPRRHRCRHRRRCGDRRSRSGRSRNLGLCLQRRPLDGRDRVGGDQGAGGDVVDDPQPPRLPRGSLAPTAQRARSQAPGSAPASSPAGP